MFDIQKIQKALKQYGLTENEAKIYLSLLELLEGSTYQISQQSGLPRSTVNYTLNSLEEKGFVEKFKKNKIQCFTPASTKIFLERLQNQQQAIEPILEDLHQLAGKGLNKKPNTSLFLGAEGIKRVYKDILKTLKDSRIKRLHAISQPELFELFPRFFPEWVQNRVKLEIHAFLIMPDSEKSRQLGFQYTNKQFGEIRFMPKKYAWPGTINIYGDKVALFSFSKEDMSAAVIENKTIANMFRTFFEFNWAQLEQLK